MSPDSSKENLPSVIENLINRLSPFIGVWVGKGEGSFPTPTVDDFKYEERTIFQRNEDAPYFKYEQTTWLLGNDGERDKIGHYESGVLRPQSDGKIILSTAQDSTRTEILVGQLDETSSLSEVLIINFESQSIEGDERMVSSQRVFHLQNEQLTYTMAMATSKVPTITHHLKANLIKKI